MSKTELTIGRLATAAGVNIETIRYYQRKGLIDEPAKPSQGFRQYSYEIVDRIRFIKRAQQLGFSLNEIIDLIALGSGRCADIRERAEIKRDMIAAQLRDLQSLHDTLDSLISACQIQKDDPQCPIIKALVKNDIQ